MHGFRSKWRKHRQCFSCALSAAYALSINTRITHLHPKKGEWKAQTCAIRPITTAGRKLSPMMKITRAFLVILTLVPIAMAQYVEPWCASRELRKNEASKLLRQLSEIDKQVPVLSPREREWLDGEINSSEGRFTPRVLRAMDSREYDVSTAKSHFALLLPDLQLLSQLKTVSYKDEVLLWAKVASRLPDGELWQAVESLVKRKIISKSSAEEFGHSFLAGNATLRSQAILNGVVIPYLGTLTCP